MANTSVSLDFGSYALKAIQAKPGTERVEVAKTAMAFNPLGINLATDEVTSEKMAQLIDTFFTDQGLVRTDVRLALPESLVSTKIISIPLLSDAELASAIPWQAEQHIPIPLEELALEYQVLYRPTRQDRQSLMRVLLIGARKSVTEKFVEIFSRAGIEPTVLETETLALIRSLQFTAEDPTTLLVQIGAFHTDMAVVENGEPRLVYSYLSGGQAYTRAIEQQAQLDTKQAEEYKRAYGLDPSQLQGKLRDILLQPTKQTILEMQKAMQFYLTQDQSTRFRRILLAGGGAQLPGLVEHITEQLGMEVLIAAPFSVASGTFPATDHPAYAVCMGLLMREKM